MLVSPRPASVALAVSVPGHTLNQPFWPVGVPLTLTEGRTV
jgi:hypothetical protein